ncbi:hypothetical protein HIM_03443 [Hirsutella minnesotensis 3608]|uniref:N-acetyltransferase domain-containing protein n=1 Tax=Hirsutella minnesotensis 3608 TaxID=1043627 RepID=A0A0F8A2N2_9HYPO|nr:hypothetical protein HIM_03443 [Hirsutella minnesotensis 3608]
MDHPYQLTTVKDGPDTDRLLPSLTELLLHCVNDDPAVSSIGFLAPLADHVATNYWRGLLSSAKSHDADTTVLVATVRGSDNVVATAQIVRMLKETHSHRGEVRKLLVHPAHRRGGLGRLMMTAAEEHARVNLGLEMLVLDTATQTPAREFYLKTTWTEWGRCPDYAKYADGAKGECSFFVKMLEGSDRPPREVDVSTPQALVDNKVEAEKRDLVNLDLNA